MCDTSTGYRDYVAAEGTHVERTYKDMYENQTLEHVSKMHEIYGQPRFAEMDVWEAIDYLNKIVDESDPDTELPQIVHALQTAESISTRMKEDPRFADKDWLPLVGLIHDLGKIMLLPEFGGLPQWSVVGDIFPVGIKLHPAAVFEHKQFHANNSAINGAVEAPKPGCGFAALDFSWSHDHYMAMVLERSGSTLPPEALYMIRYHSFYPWHTPPKSWDIAAQGRPYIEFASEKDKEMLPYVHLLQRADLYSKTRVVPEKQMYEDLVKKYIPHKLRF